MVDPSYSESGLAAELDDLKDSQVYRWLHAQLHVYSDAAISMRDEVELRLMQGRCQCIKELILVIDKAADKAWNQREAAKRHEALKQHHQKQF